MSFTDVLTKIEEKLFLDTLYYKTMYDILKLPCYTRHKFGFIPGITR